MAAPEDEDRAIADEEADDDYPVITSELVREASLPSQDDDYPAIDWEATGDGH